LSPPDDPRFFTHCSGDESADLDMLRCDSPECLVPCSNRLDWRSHPGADESRRVGLDLVATRGPWKSRTWAVRVRIRFQNRSAARHLSGGSGFLSSKLAPDMQAVRHSVLTPGPARNATRSTGRLNELTIEAQSFFPCHVPIRLCKVIPWSCAAEPGPCNAIHYHSDHTWGAWPWISSSSS
jgi:hypothetical protein